MDENVIDVEHMRTAGDEMRRKCGADKKNCKCEYRFSATDPKGPNAVCPKCGAPRPCERLAMANGRCQVHGGLTPAGIANPNLTAGGKYSKYLPIGLLEIWNELVTDEELLNGLDDVKLLHCRLATLMRSNNSFDVFGDLQAAWSEFERASRMPDGAEDDKEAKKAKQDAISAALAEINNLIRKGKGESGRWQEIYSI